MLLASFPAPLAHAQGSSPLGFGFPLSYIIQAKNAAQEAGGTIGYASEWVGWADPDQPYHEDTVRRYVRQSLANNTVPVLYWYYWGDSISPSCVEQGTFPSGGSCGKSKAEWNQRRDMLARVLDEELPDGKEAIVIIENEFHKNGIDDLPYATTFDGYLRDANNKFHTVPGVKTVIGFGPWAAGDDSYKNFPRAVETSDMLGSMILYSAVAPGASQRISDPNGDLCSPTPVYKWGDRPASYANGITDLLNILTELWQYYGPNGQYSGPDVTSSIVYDLGFASFNDTVGNHFNEYCSNKTGAKNVDAGAAYSPSEQETDGKAWEGRQYSVLSEMFNRSAEFKAKGVEAIVFRAYEDGRGNAPETNYHILAEWWFGLKQTSKFAGDGVTKKSAHDMVFQRIGQETGTPPNVAPTASFSADCTNATCSFDGSASTDPDGAIVSWSWNFGDGTTGSGVSATKTYTVGGTYTVTLTVTDNDGATGTSSRSVTVTTQANVAPVADFSSTCSQTTCTFDASASSDADGTISSYAWTFGDGTSGAGKVVSRTYAASGTYSVRLVVTDNGGATGSKDKVVTVTSGSQTSSLLGRYEAESFDWMTDGMVTNNASWSGGKGWNLYTNGFIQENATNDQAARYAFTVRAKGDLAGPQYPHMILWVNGVKIGEWDLGSSSLLNYTATYDAPVGTTTMKIEFTNDYLEPDGDRNIRIDYLHVDFVPSALPGKFEAENFPTKSTGGVVTSSSWSGGKGWNIWTNGHIEQKVYNGKTGQYKLDIRAAGDLAGPAYPHMVLRINGAIAAEWDVTSTSLLTYGTTQTIPAGDVTLRIEFTNDYLQNGQDRNLKVDFLNVTDVASDLPGSFEAESFQSRPVGGVTNNAAYSGGKGWNIWTFGKIEHTVNNGVTRTYKITIRAAGDLAGPDEPHMRLWVNGVNAGEWDVVSTSLLDYSATRSIAAGAVTFGIEFTNDYLQNGQDRNLKVDYVKVEIV